MNRMLMLFTCVVLLVTSCAKENHDDAPQQGGEDASMRALEFATTDDADFERLPEKPRKGDWLDVFKERGQTFEEYVKSGPVRPNEKRNRIVLQPIGTFDKKQKDMLEILREYCMLFFQCSVTLAEPIDIPEDAPSRVRKWGRSSWKQYKTGYFLYDILKPRLPNDAICYLGITMVDLYPDESWNYVFGEASLRDRVGVYSLVRFFPSFWGQEETDEGMVQALRRSCKTLVHEALHMFTMHHCIYYKCLMNGANSLEEQDRRPLRLCPECLKKLQWNIGFDVVKRYEALEKFFRQVKLEEEALWTARRLERIHQAVGGSSRQE